MFRPIQALRWVKTTRFSWTMQGWLLSCNVALAAFTLRSQSLTRMLIECSELKTVFLRCYWETFPQNLRCPAKGIAKWQPKQRRGVISHFCKEGRVTNMWTRSSASNDNYLQSCEVGGGQPASVIPCPHDSVCQTDTHAGDTWPTCILVAHVDAREGNVSGCLILEWRGRDPVAVARSLARTPWVPLTNLEWKITSHV